MKRIFWSGHSYPVGTSFYLKGSRHYIKLIDVVQDAELMVIVDPSWTEGQLPMSAAEFGYFVETEGFVPFEEPKYVEGDRFVHHLNNDTVEVIRATGRPNDVNGRHMYFCNITKEDGTIYQISIDESYLDALIKMDSKVTTLPVPPEFAELPYVEVEDIQ